MQPIIIVHGGAGNVPPTHVQGKLDGVRVAVKTGYECLINGGSALDAVEAAVVSMETDENFNAGYGSVLNVRGEVEMDASIMRGEDLNAGAVTMVKEFKHPVSIARKVLTDSSHTFLGGEGAKLFAIEKGFPVLPSESLITDNTKRAFNYFLNRGEFDTTEFGIQDEIDSNGHVAAATSTGGMYGKAVGRIADTAQIGCGTYADDYIGAVSCTGHGETITKYCGAHSIIKLMENGLDANTATVNAVHGMTSRLNNGAGAITLSKDGEVAVYFNTNTMPWAYVRHNTIFYGVVSGQIKEENYTLSR